MLILRYWLRNLFTDADGAFSERRWAVISVIAGIAITGTLIFVTRNLPATSHPGVTVVVNDPSGAPVTVVMQP